MNKQLEKLVLQFQDYFNRFDNWSVKYCRTEKHTLPDTLAPVFIIGAPRTGSTFLLQQMLKSFKFVYITNVMALMPNHMLKFFTAFKKEILTYSDIKKSEFGYIKGLHSPNEAGQLFEKWFKDFSTEDEQKLVESTISYMSIKANAPFICKNLYNSLRLQHISRIFPSSKFIHISRDPFFTAQSILEARKKNTETTTSGSVLNHMAV